MVFCISFQILYQVDRWETTEIVVRATLRRSNSIFQLEITNFKSSVMDDNLMIHSKIEELEATKLSLKAQVKELQDFMDNAALPLHWVNGSGIIIWANKAELDLLGYNHDEYVNQHISKFHEDPEVIEDILRQLVNKKTLINVPARLRCKNGSIRCTLLNSNVYWEDGIFKHTRCFTTDVTFLLNEGNSGQFVNTPIVVK
jgi:two-component system sensor histidine kinase VicK